MTLFPENLSLKSPLPNRKDARFAFHTRRAVQSAIADLLGVKADVSDYATITNYQLFT